MITPSFPLTATERVLPRLALNFTTGTLDPRITFARTGNTATVINSSGYVVSINENLPRFDYDPISLTCKGLLVEESRTNSILQSEDFSTTWTTSNASVSTNQATSPSNTTTADKIVEDSANTGHFVSQTVSCTASQAYTFSVYVKAAGRTQCRIRATGSGSWLSAVIDLTTGLVVGSPTGTISVVAAGNSWYRISGTANSDFTGNNVFYVYPAAGGTWVYQGNGVDGVFAWGAQLEAGAFATSYIPTTTTALTRNADVATMTGTNFSDWFNASEGTFSIDCIINTKPAAQILMEMSDGTSNNRLQFQRDSSSSNLTYASIVGGAIPVNLSRTGAFVSDVGSICAAYKLDSYAVAVQGGSVATDTSGGVPPLDRLRIGATVAGTAPSSGWYQKISYYQQRVINAEVQAFSK